MRFALSSLLTLLGLLLVIPALGQKHSSASDSIPADSVLLGLTPQRALIITAHDDDAVAFAGTVALLDSNGWHTGFLCFPSADTARNFRHLLASSYIVDTSFFLEPASYRLDVPGNKVPHVPMARSKFGEVYRLEEIAANLEAQINAFKPTVIFTLDDQIGGYGHPDHVMLSGLVRELAMEGRIRPAVIYQGVYSDEIEEEIIVKRLGGRLERMGLPNPYVVAKGVYEVEGIPAPEVRVDVSAVQEAKTYYLELYGQQGGSDMHRLMHDFEKYNATKFHQLFTYEYFRVISFR